MKIRFANYGIFNKNVKNSAWISDSETTTTKKAGEYTKSLW